MICGLCLILINAVICRNHDGWCTLLSTNIRCRSQSVNTEDADRSYHSDIQLKGGYHATAVILNGGLDEIVYA